MSGDSVAGCRRAAIRRRCRARPDRLLPLVMPPLQRANREDGSVPPTLPGRHGRARAQGYAVSEASPSSASSTAAQAAVRRAFVAVWSVRQRGSGRIGHHGVVGECHQDDGEVPANVLGPSLEAADPTADRALGPAQIRGHRYLQPGPDHLGRIRPARPDPLREHHVRDLTARTPRPARPYEPTGPARSHFMASPCPAGSPIGPPPSPRNLRYDCYARVTVGSGTGTL